MNLISFNESLLSRYYAYEAGADGTDLKIVMLGCYSFLCFLYCAYELYSLFKNRPTKVLLVKGEEFSDEELQGLKNSHYIAQQLKFHRFDVRLENNQLPKNTDFENCDRETTAKLHHLTEKMFSNHNLKENIPMFEKTAEDLMKKYVNDQNSLLFLGPMLTDYFRLVLKNLMTLDLAKEGLSLKLTAGLTSDLTDTNLRLLPTLIEEAIRVFRDNPELQNAAYQAIKRNEEEGFCEAILRVIIELIRLRPLVTGTKRGKEILNLAPLSSNPAIVGPKPKEFNLNRLDKLPIGWPKLPGTPFGGGPHVCPAWRYVKFVAAQFLTTLLTKYQIVSSPTNTGAFFIPRDRIPS